MAVTYLPCVEEEEEQKRQRERQWVRVVCPIQLQDVIARIRVEFA